jgi:hypothetical protein
MGGATPGYDNGGASRPHIPIIGRVGETLNPAGASMCVWVTLAWIVVAAIAAGCLLVHLVAEVRRW